MLHVLLHTRDALGLVVDGPGVPPRLSARPSAIDRPVGEHEETAPAWATWWRDHLSLAVVLQGFQGGPALAPWTRHLPPSPDPEDRRRSTMGTRR